MAKANLLLFLGVATLLVGDALGAGILPPHKPPKPTRTPRPPKTTTTVRPPPDAIQTEGCGGVLEGNTGLLSYQYSNSETYSPNEICVWTIRAPGAGQIELSVEGDGFTDRELNYISILTVGGEAKLQKSHKIFGGDRSKYTTEGQIAYVLFRSSPSSNTGPGFQLYFKGVKDTEDASHWTGGNKTHIHFHLNKAMGRAERFSYPPEKEERDASGVAYRHLYRPDEFASWVVNPELPKIMNTLILNYIDFEDFTCADFINIHKIEGDSPVFIEKRCNTNTHFSSSFRHNTAKEPFIITFHTNYQNQRSGFVLYYENDRYQ